jgi:glyoxylase-like metal-dependent hydrolase (beta-lactamase superfamily II)
VTYCATIGRFELTSLQVWPLQQIPTQEVLIGTNNKDLEQARILQPQFFGDDTTLVELTQNVCVIRDDKNIVLVDTGQPIKRAGSILQWGLASLGIEPRHINIVFLSHRDDDHVGGTIDLHGEPLYPNATYLMSRLEYQSFKTDAQRAPEFQACIQPLETRGLLELFEDDAEIAPGLTTVPTPGHRLGATSLRVQDDGRAALFLADTLHLPMQITYPAWSSVWDSDKDHAFRTRERIIDQAEHEGWLLAIPHTPFGGLGYVKRKDGHRVWSPLIKD